MRKKALITGITGQDGSYLAEFLRENGCEVHGIKRCASSFNTQRIDHIYEDPHSCCDLSDHVPPRSYALFQARFALQELGKTLRAER